MESPVDVVKEAIANGLWREEKGTCDVHGESVVKFPKKINASWFCPACSEVRHKEGEHAAWMRDRSETLHRIADIPRKFRDQKFVANTPAQKSARLMVKSYRDFIIENGGWAVLMMIGDVGTGKTLMACEFAESLINNNSISARYCTAKQMISEIQSSYGSQDGRSEESEILKFVQYGVLVLDEIDVKPDKENANLLLTEVINRRYNQERPVVVITNQAFDNLDKHIGSRVTDRLHENSFVCNFDWPSFRRGEA
ncbi:MAG: ATP-binding protein [Alphaproteobacteria bacterium]|nr:ATP-binding protein [Alphaproteobacteria bacterium]